MYVQVATSVVQQTLPTDNRTGKILEERLLMRIMTKLRVIG